MLYEILTGFLQLKIFFSLNNCKIKIFNNYCKYPYGRKCISFMRRSGKTIFNLGWESQREVF